MSTLIVLPGIVLAEFGHLDELKRVEKRRFSHFSVGCLVTGPFPVLILFLLSFLYVLCLCSLFISQLLIILNKFSLIVL